ncbi:MAG TPA: glucosyl-3-phosphoglycerate synthase [Solirubrobacteraceae bacterium]|nr:glucosyl-3-phosphoglycerate synthase [Solirubrobacteraceae bacterium]
MAPPARSSSADPSDEHAKARTFHHSAYSAQTIAAAGAERGLGATVCLPARECAASVGEIVAALVPLREAGAIERIVVVDAASSDGTAAVAEHAGAEVWQEAELLPSFGPVLGKGDAMWRALSRIDSQLVCFADADSELFSAHFVTGLLGPLLCEPDVSFVKAFYRRPLAGEGSPPGEGGGRVNHLTARPALALFYPELAEIRQPLAGEVAAQRELLLKLPFATGYGVEIAMLIDAWHEVGLQRIAQVDLEEHHNQHQPLAALAPMAQTVLATLARRMEQEGRLAFGVGDHAPPERPPLASLRAQ